MHLKNKNTQKSSKLFVQNYKYSRFINLLSVL